MTVETRSSTAFPPCVCSIVSQCLTAKCSCLLNKINCTELCKCFCKCSRKSQEIKDNLLKAKKNKRKPINENPQSTTATITDQDINRIVTQEFNKNFEKLADIVRSTMHETAPNIAINVSPPEVNVDITELLNKLNDKDFRDSQLGLIEISLGLENEKDPTVTLMDIQESNQENKNKEAIYDFHITYSPHVTNYSQKKSFQDPGCNTNQVNSCKTPESNYGTQFVNTPQSGLKTPKPVRYGPSFIETLSSINSPQANRSFYVLQHAPSSPFKSLVDNSSINNDFLSQMEPSLVTHFEPIQPSSIDLHENIGLSPLSREIQSYIDSSSFFDFI